MNDLVSVVVPIYNVEKFLDKCINSIVNQTYKNLEIILVDDGSPDNCPEMCDNWAEKDSRIKVVHKKNEGAGQARNTGIDTASGKYILFVDSDDYIHSEAIKSCVDAAERENAQVVLFSLYNVSANGHEKPVFVIPQPKAFAKNGVQNELLPSLFVHTFGYGVSVWGKMFSTEIIKTYNIRFVSEREYYSEDALFVLEYFSKIDSAYALNKRYYYYFQNTSSLSRVYVADRENKVDDYLLKSIGIAQSNRLPDMVVAYIKARYHGCVMSKLKQIFLAELPKAQKRRALRKEYNNKVLQSTLTKDVFNVEKRSLSIFYRMMKLRLYCLCDLLLWYRINK